MWIASYPKSGNTWCRVFIHNMALVLSGHQADSSKLDEFKELSGWEISLKLFPAKLGKPPNECSAEEIAAVRPSVQRELAKSHPGVAFVKTHNALMQNYGHPTINLSATFGAIYIVRNPLDVCLSLAAQNNTGIDEAIDEMACKGFVHAASPHSAHEVYGSWTQNVFSWTRQSNPAFLIVRYEDMITDPKAVFRRISRHLQINPSEEQLAEAIRRSSFDEMTSKEKDSGQKLIRKAETPFFRVGKMDQWKTELSDVQMNRVIAEHGEQMRRFGYL